MKRRFDEKTIGMDLLVHKELKILADRKGLKMKDLLMNKDVYRNATFVRK